jgi:hypothetical protein
VYLKYSACRCEFCFIVVSVAGELRRSGAVQVLTPADCLALAATDSDLTLCLHPLAGGMPDAVARASVERFLDEVLPHLSKGRP